MTKVCISLNRNRDAAQFSLNDFTKQMADGKIHGLKNVGQNFLVPLQKTRRVLISHFRSTFLPMRYVKRIYACIQYSLFVHDGLTSFDNFQITFYPCVSISMLTSYIPFLQGVLFKVFIIASNYLLA